MSVLRQAARARPPDYLSTLAEAATARELEVWWFADPVWRDLYRRYRRVRPIAQEPAWLAARLEICRRCGRWAAGAHTGAYAPASCELSPACTPCYRRRPGAVCPAEPPLWGPVAEE